MFENLLYFHLHVCLCLHKFMYVICVGDLEAKRESNFPGAEVTDGYELFDVGARN